MDYHVSKKGSDKNIGSMEAPFLTIQRAADCAVAGDTVIVHEGVYREWVKPQNSGAKNFPITYESAKNEKVIIKGSERIDNWERVENGVWKVALPDTFFNGFNPFVEEVGGDWLEFPKNPSVHLGDVYLNGKSFYEAFSLEEVKNPTPKTECRFWTWDEGRDRHLEDVDGTVFVWFAQHDLNSDTTVIYANFHEYNPNKEFVEINVRKCCFFPEKTGLDYITVRGFEMAQAASPWAPPTAKQYGLLGTNWSKGWIIENNILHDAKCSAISLGKEESIGQNDFTKGRVKPGYQYQMEAVFKARHIGWDKERIGSHVIRFNKIYDCGQNGIVGHLGCIFSSIYGNEIYRIATKYEFFGYEIAGIKLHAAIDVQIKNNYIHNCMLGTWMDWETQGTRISSNIYDKNRRDLLIEVSHGPCLVDNNIFTSDYALNNVSQGNAYIHNLICGFMEKYDVLDRTTPYHLPHSTELLGTAFIYGNDDRWMNNIFVGKKETDKDYSKEIDGRICYGTAIYNGCPASWEEYKTKVYSIEGDHQIYFKIPQAVYIHANAYFNGAKKFDCEKDSYVDDTNPGVKIVTESDGVYLEMNIPEKFFDSSLSYGKVFECDSLEVPRLTQQHFENPDGSSIVLDEDLTGEIRYGSSMAGPIQGLKPGINKILIWEI